MNRLLSFMYNRVGNFLLSNGSGDVQNVETAQNAPSGIWSVLSNALKFFWIQIVAILDLVVTTILKLLYIIVEFVLKMIDLIYIFFKELAGMNQVVNLLDSEDITNSDLIFQFLYSDTVKKILIRMFVFGIVLLIIFTIVAIVKSEYAAAITDGNNTKKQVLVGSLRALFLMFMVPIIGFGGIILSNTVLASISNSFTGSANIDMGATAFIASGYQANRYRQYADSNELIPITYELEEIDEKTMRKVPTNGTKNQVEEDFEAIAKSSAWNTGFVTYMTFQTGKFYYRNEISSAYYLTYDRNLSPNGNIYNKDTTNYEARNDYTFKTDYYVMADLQDMFVKYNVPFYYVKSSDNLTVKYSTGETRTYIANRNASSEEEGAVFTIAIQPTEVSYREDGGITTRLSKDKVIIKSGERIFYYKVYNKKGKLDESRSKSFVFNSPYLKSESNILAKGVMSEEGYPTTIKQNSDGTILCYRDYINVPLIADLFPQITYEPNPNYTESLTTRFLKKGVQVLVGVDPNDFIPYLYFRFDVWTLFSKDEYITYTQEPNDPLTLTYMFSDETDMMCHYDLKQMNWVVLVLTVTVLFSILGKSCIGLVMRAFDVVVLMIIYPMVASVLPLDGGERAKKWNSEFIGRLFMAYGVVISLNFVFLIVPLIEDLNLIADGSVSGFLSFIPAQAINIIIELMFTLVLFTFIQSGIKMVSALFALNAKNPLDAYSVGESNLAKVVGTRNPYTGKMKGGLLGDTKELVSGSKMQDVPGSILGKKGDAGWIPGSVLFGNFKDKRKKKKQHESLGNLMQNMRDGDAKAIKYGTQQQKNMASNISNRNNAQVASIDPKKKKWKFNR